MLYAAVNTTEEDARTVNNGFRWNAPKRDRNSPMKLPVAGKAILARMNRKNKRENSGIIRAKPR